MKKIIFGLSIATILFACGSSQNFHEKTLKPARDVPEAFVTKPGTVYDEVSCKSPLKDPRDNTEIVMVMAERGKGDYRVPSGKYGVGAGELLRIECSTGKVLGIVKQ